MTMTRTQLRRKKRLHKWVVNLILFLSIIGLSICLWVFFFWNQDNKKTEKLIEEIHHNVKVEEVDDTENTEIVNPPEEDVKNDYWDFIKIPLMSVNFHDLLSRNPDTVGWIEVKGTNINYPIVQTNDNEYYLKHAFDKSKNSAGWVYGDYRSDFKNFGKNTIIYGHGRLDSTVFGSLRNTLNKSWYQKKDNWIIRLSTPYENSVWQIFSIYTLKPDSDYLQTNFDEGEFESFLNLLKERSIYNFDTTVGSDDKIITLSTCKDNTDRLVVHAKLIKRESRN